MEEAGRASTHYLAFRRMVIVVARVFRGLLTSTKAKNGVHNPYHQHGLPARLITAVTGPNGRLSLRWGFHARHLCRRPPNHATGAGAAFVSGRQANGPVLTDKGGQVCLLSGPMIATARRKTCFPIPSGWDTVGGVGGWLSTSAFSQRHLPNPPSFHNQRRIAIAGQAPIKPHGVLTDPSMACLLADALFRYSFCLVPHC